MCEHLMLVVAVAVRMCAGTADTAADTARLSRLSYVNKHCNTGSSGAHAHHPSNSTAAAQPQQRQHEQQRTWYAPTPPLKDLTSSRARLMASGAKISPTLG